LRIFVINSKSDEVLDFKKYEKEGIGLTAIAIGGLSLSRGLTIEGLTISYMYRNTQMYDTLMQMARWFGYRPGFEDICRVHLPQDSIDWYSHIADASEGLRQQIKRMKQEGLSPRQFGLYVKTHSDSLLITAANKMRSGEKVILNQNFTGELVESYFVPVDKPINNQNEELITDFWRKEFGGKIESTEKGWFVKDVRVEVIASFLNQFRVHRNFALQKGSAVSYLNAISDTYPVGDVLLISTGKDVGEYRLGVQERAVKTIIGDSWRLNGYRVASRGDEKLGLTTDQIREAEDKAQEGDENSGKKPSDTHYRAVRNKPLLMLHVLAPKDTDKVYERVPAFGLSFPYGLYHVEIEVVANRVWLEQMYGSLDDSPDDEDDYDE
jgi:hypothetical protein